LAVALAVVKITLVQTDYEEAETEVQVAVQVVQMVVVQQGLPHQAKDMVVVVTKVHLPHAAGAVVREAQELLQMVDWEQHILSEAIIILLREVAVAHHGQEQAEQAYQEEAREVAGATRRVQVAHQILVVVVVVVAIKAAAGAQVGRVL
jgi:hypothetical protein